MAAKSKRAKAGENYQRTAQKWELASIRGIWDEIKSGRPIPDWGSGKAFEYMVIRAFELSGLNIRWPHEVTYPQRFGTMEQLDGIVYLGERAFLVESKAESEPLAIEAFAKLRFRLEGRPPGTMGILFSVTDFSLPTEVFAQFASPLNVLLWGRTDLDAALSKNTMKQALEQKLLYAIEEGLPLYPLGGLS